ncbi:MAG: hypothetical protein NT023_15245 [Armatimonadetes bacterium]|nr:hypothetical protein [Armatimonadota bacterium]
MKRDTVTYNLTSDGACEHCGGYVVAETKRCPQCSKFPIKLHHCPKCKNVSGASEAKCWKCGRVFMPEGDYL